MVTYSTTISATAAKWQDANALVQDLKGSLFGDTSPKIHMESKNEDKWMSVSLEKQACENRFFKRMKIFRRICKSLGKRLLVLSTSKGKPNKFPLYKVYMGLIIKGTIPKVSPFSL